VAAPQIGEQLKLLLLGEWLIPVADGDARLFELREEALDRDSHRAGELFDRYFTHRCGLRR